MSFKNNDAYYPITSIDGNNCIIIYNQILIKKYLKKKIIINYYHLINQDLSPTYHKFYVGIGHYLQYLESQILIKVLLGLKDLGIHALPIHDAVVVGRAWVDMSKELMEQVFRL